jgi:hypothetical protein
MKSCAGPIRTVSAEICLLEESLIYGVSCRTGLVWLCPVKKGAAGSGQERVECLVEVLGS